MKNSIKLTIRDNTKADGKAALRLLVTINSKRHFIPLDLDWPPTYFDARKGEILRRTPKDKDFNDYNIIIRSKVDDVNEIFKIYRLSGRELSLEQFRKELENFTIRHSFSAYMKQKIEERKKDKKISKATAVTHTSAHKHLVNFKQEVFFYELTPRLLEQFEAWMKKRIPKRSSRNKYLRHLRTYMQLALADHKVFDYPFKKFKISTDQFDQEFLEEHELEAIKAYYQAGTTGITHKRVCRTFLIGCFTGLRISDLTKNLHDFIVNDELVFTPTKTEYLDKKQRIPLNAWAKRLLQDHADDDFKTYADQFYNRQLKVIAKKLEIQKEMYMHMARHTFATRFLEKGGAVEVLQKYLGHSKIETTMKYVHITDKRRREQIHLLD